MRKFSVLVCFFVLLAASVIAQETKKITGKVTDANGEVLSGVTVVEVNGKAKAVSNDQGIYTITVSGKTTTCITLLQPTNLVFVKVNYS